MDMEQEEMQFLGFFGIFSEAYKLILSRRRIFSQIIITLILPLSLLALVHTEVSNMLVNKIITNEEDLDQTQAGTTKYKKLSDLILSEWGFLFFFKAAYLTLLLVLSLLSTAAVVYTIASVYTARNGLSYAKVMSVVPKVWKRLIVTFLWTFLAFFAYHVVAFFVLALLALLAFSFNVQGFAAAILSIAFLAIYALGVVYLSLVWQLASVVSVLEEARGIGAMRKSQALTSGKMWTSILVLGTVIGLSFVLQIVFQNLVVLGPGNALALRVFFGVLCLLGSVTLVLLGLVVQTILYFVCKSYHHENIDKSALSDHLEVYLGEYVPLTSKDVQLEQYNSV